MGGAGVVAGGEGDATLGRVRCSSVLGGGSVVSAAILLSGAAPTPTKQRYAHREK